MTITERFIRYYNYSLNYLIKHRWTAYLTVIAFLLGHGLQNTAWVDIAGVQVITVLSSLDGPFLKALLMPEPLILLCALVIAIITLHAQKRAERTKATIEVVNETSKVIFGAQDIYEDWREDSEKFLAITDENIGIQGISKLYGEELLLSNTDDEEKNVRNRKYNNYSLKLLNSYEKLTTGIKQGFYDEKIIIEWFGANILYDYIILKMVIEHQYQDDIDILSAVVPHEIINSHGAAWDSFSAWVEKKYPQNLNYWNYYIKNIKSSFHDA